MRWLEQQRQQSGIAANRIIIELTETQPVAALDAAGVYILRRAIAGLRDLGYGVALDDVGPAMPNHRALFGLNFSSVKLDKDLVFQAADNPEAGAFLAETIALAHAAGCAVVAEGVRDLATWERMRRAGADLAQGFMVARPLPAASVGVWMQGWQTQQGATDLHEHQPA
jgi:EAL domain-containing protein (putative c-di-GMP-specific phosphodiesterase class I)